MHAIFGKWPTFALVDLAVVLTRRGNRHRVTFFVISTCLVFFRTSAKICRIKGGSAGGSDGTGAATNVGPCARPAHFAVASFLSVRRGVGFFNAVSTLWPTFALVDLAVVLTRRGNRHLVIWFVISTCLVFFRTSAKICRIKGGSAGGSDGTGAATNVSPGFRPAHFAVASFISVRRGVGFFDAVSTIWPAFALVDLAVVLTRRGNRHLVTWFVISTCIVLFGTPIKICRIKGGSGGGRKGTVAGTQFIPCSRPARFAVAKFLSAQRRVCVIITPLALWERLALVHNRNAIVTRYSDLLIRLVGGA